MCAMCHGNPTHLPIYLPLDLSESALGNVYISLTSSHHNILGASYNVDEKKRKEKKSKIIRHYFNHATSWTNLKPNN